MANERFVYVLDYKERAEGFTYTSARHVWHVGIFGTLERAKNEASPKDRNVSIVWENDGPVHIGDDKVSGRVWTIKQERVR